MAMTRQIARSKIYGGQSRKERARREHQNQMILSVAAKNRPRGLEPFHRRVRCHHIDNVRAVRVLVLAEVQLLVPPEIRRLGERRPTKLALERPFTSVDPSVL